MSNSKEKDEEKPVVAKTAVDLQRLKLVKLMKNIVSTTFLIALRFFCNIVVSFELEFNLWFNFTG